MKTLMLSVITVGLLAIGAAQEPPLPTALKTAKTLYLVNGGVPMRQLEQTVAALTKWGRFTLVADAEMSDITMTLTAQPTKQIYNFAIGRSVPVNSLFLSITATSGGTVLYGTAFTGNPDSEFKKLRKRLEAQ